MILKVISTHCDRILRYSVIHVAVTNRQFCKVINTRGRVIAQAATRFRARVESWRICDRRSGTGARFLWVLPLPLPILIPQTAAHSPSSGAGLVSQTVAGIPSSLSLRPLQTNKELTHEIIKRNIRKHRNSICRRSLIIPHSHCSRLERPQVAGGAL